MASDPSHTQGLPAAPCLSRQSLPAAYCTSVPRQATALELSSEPTALYHTWTLPALALKTVCTLNPSSQGALGHTQQIRHTH